MVARKIKVQVVVFQKAESGIRYLALFTKPERGSFWQNVTGSVEPNEYLLQAAHREVLEETGVRGVSPAIDLTYRFTYPTQYGPIEEHCFAIEAETDAIQIDAAEHVDSEWVDFAEALKRLKFESNRTAIQRTRQYLESGSPGNPLIENIAQN